MQSCPVWFSLTLLLSLAAVDPLAVAGQEDAQGQEVPIAVTAYFTTLHRCQPAELFVTACLKPGYCLYSITQPSGGPNRTIIKLDESSAFRLYGPFAAIQQPWYEKTPWPEWPVVEKHLGCVTWHAVIEFASGVDPDQLTIKGAVTCQVDAKTFCIPPTSYTFIAAPGPPGVCASHRQPEHRFLCRARTVQSRLTCGWLWWVWRCARA
jgi:hypothetical protein